MLILVIFILFVVVVIYDSPYCFISSDSLWPSIILNGNGSVARYCSRKKTRLIFMELSSYYHFWTEVQFFSYFFFQLLWCFMILACFHTLIIELMFNHIFFLYFAGLKNVNSIKEPNQSSVCRVGAVVIDHRNRKCSRNWWRQGFSLYFISR